MSFPPDAEIVVLNGDAEAAEAAGAEEVAAVVVGAGVTVPACALSMLLVKTTQAATHATQNRQNVYKFDSSDSDINDDVYNNRYSLIETGMKLKK